MLSHLLQDFRYSARALRKNPGFAAIAIITLTLGIGANTAIFSMVDKLIFRPLPISHPEELVRVFNGETRGNPEGGFVSLPNYLEYRDGMTAFSGLAAYLDVSRLTSPPANLAPSGLTPALLRPTISQCWAPRRNWTNAGSRR